MDKAIETKKKIHPIWMVVHQTKKLLEYLQGDETTFGIINHNIDEISRFSGMDNKGNWIEPQGSLIELMQKDMNRLESQLAEKDKQIEELREGIRNIKWGNSLSLDAQRKITDLLPKETK